MSKLDREIDAFVESQIRSASGRRLEMLKKDLTGTKKLLKELLYPVFQSFDGFILEYELISQNGYRIYIDVFYVPLQIAFECEGFVVHAELITREKFSLERMRIRTIAEFEYKYVPFTWDELDQKAMACRRSLYNIIGRHTVAALHDLSIYEREVIRCASMHIHPFRMTDVENWLSRGRNFCKDVIRSLLDKNIISPLRDGQRVHQYVMTERLQDAKGD